MIFLHAIILALIIDFMISRIFCVSFWHLNGSIGFCVGFFSYIISWRLLAK
jgi:hypothetical protein